MCAVLCRASVLFAVVFAADVDPINIHCPQKSKSDKLYCAGEPACCSVLLTFVFPVGCFVSNIGKVKCALPGEAYGTNTAAAVTGQLQTVAPKSACKPLKSKPASDNALAVVSNGFCSLVKKAENVARAGFKGMVVQGKKRPKASQSDQAAFFPIPVVILAPEAYKAFQKRDKDATMSITLQVSEVMIRQISHARVYVSPEAAPIHQQRSFLPQCYEICC